jgi:hypothetical protein
LDKLDLRRKKVAFESPRPETIMSEELEPSKNKTDQTPEESPRSLKGPTSIDKSKPSILKNANSSTSGNQLHSE